jgi:hypothetical protein
MQFPPCNSHSQHCSLGCFSEVVLGVDWGEHNSLGVCNVWENFECIQFDENYLDFMVPTCGLKVFGGGWITWYAAPFKASLMTGKYRG